MQILALSWQRISNFRKNRTACTDFIYLLYAPAFMYYISQHDHNLQCSMILLPKRWEIWQLHCRKWKLMENGQGNESACKSSLHLQYLHRQAQAGLKALLCLPGRSTFIHVHCLLIISLFRESEKNTLIIADEEAWARWSLVALLSVCLHVLPGRMLNLANCTLWCLDIFSKCFFPFPAVPNIYFCLFHLIHPAQSPEIDTLYRSSYSKRMKTNFEEFGNFTMRISHDALASPVSDWSLQKLTSLASTRAPCIRF